MEKWLKIDIAITSRSWRYDLFSLINIEVLAYFKIVYDGVVSASFLRGTIESTEQPGIRVVHDWFFYHEPVIEDLIFFRRPLQVLQEAPNRNFFSLTGFILMPLNAMWELFQSLVILSSKHGTDYRESSASILFRLLGLVVPGVASHSPCNYVNSVRLGPFPLGERLKGDIADLAEEVRLVNDNIKDIFNVILSGLPAVPGKDIWKFALEKLLAALK